MRGRQTLLSILDLGCSVSWSVNERWRLKLGYELSQWNDSSVHLQFPDDVNDGAVRAESRDISWDGFSLGAGVSF